MTPRKKTTREEHPGHPGNQASGKGHSKTAPSLPAGKQPDDAWTKRVLDRLRSELWSATSSQDRNQHDDARIDAILERLRLELWSSPADAKEHDAWADTILEKLRSELWTIVTSDATKQPSPEELKRVDSILAKLKSELWDR